MKTTQKQFEEFKEEFLKYQKLFNLEDWKVYFNMKPLARSYADITTNIQCRVAVVNLSSDNSGEAIKDFNPKRSAKHEAAHLLIERLTALGKARYLDEYSMSEENERLAHLLTTLLPDA